MQWNKGDIFIQLYVFRALLQCLIQHKNTYKQSKSVNWIINKVSSKSDPGGKTIIFTLYNFLLLS